MTRQRQGEEGRELEASYLPDLQLSRRVSVMNVSWGQRDEGFWLALAVCSYQLVGYSTHSVCRDQQCYVYLRPALL